MFPVFAVLIIFFTVIVLTVACCLSIANAKPFNKCLDDLAERIITDMERQGKVYLAVADFTDLEGRTSALGVFISEVFGGLCGPPTLPDRPFP